MKLSLVVSSFAVVVATTGHAITLGLVGHAERSDGNFAPSGLVQY
jgi:hypothetical protein